MFFLIQIFCIKSIQVDWIDRSLLILISIESPNELVFEVSWSWEVVSYLELLSVDGKAECQIRCKTLRPCSHTNVDQVLKWVILVV